MIITTTFNPRPAAKCETRIVREAPRRDEIRAWSRVAAANRELAETKAALGAALGALSAANVEVARLSRLLGERDEAISKANAEIESLKRGTDGHAQPKKAKRKKGKTQEAENPATGNAPATESNS